MLKLINIQKWYSNHHIFSIEELTLPAGIYWLKGANGAGKSTFMKILAGLIPFKGEVFIDEKISLRKNPVHYRLLVNHAESEPVYPSFLTGNELVEFVSKLKKGTKELINETRNILGIDDYLQNPIGSYSSGMLKKLSLLLAFIGNPKLILLDEPLTTLDQSSQKALCILILQQRQINNTSFIITSHHDIENNDIHFDKNFILKDKQLLTVTQSL
ncbi:MAG: ATP-binding cassette domain-containing protein [Chitinophagaceae bacterium]